ncbi:MAG: S8 family serine peptidase [Acidobacteriota bacterium]|nr:S8 family serine peptidase [Acidobacteriota bacterium]MDQ7087841.1 S8 family serine peptidase [Acidobacteriota bacterium]
MFHAPRHLTVALVLCLLAGLVPSPFAAEDDSPKWRGELAEVIRNAAPGERIPVSIILGEQLHGEALRAHAEGIKDPDRRRRILADALKNFARQHQARLRLRLEQADRAGQVRRLRFLWIGNIVAADLPVGLIREITAYPEVDHLNWEPKRDVFIGPRMTPEILPDNPLTRYRGNAGTDEIECGVDLMQAPRVWNELGNTGEGAVIAMIDSGTCWSHSDIENQIWVNPGEDLDGDGVVMDPDDQNGIDDDGNGYVDDLIGYDIGNGDNDPNDDDSHGSHTSGTVAGDGTAGTQAGMAPDARVMILRVGLQFSDEPDVWEAMQYAADNGADAISMSLGWPHDQNPDRATWRTNCENTIDLGTAMVIAAGNEGSGNEPDNIRTPGDVPRVITVGATNCSDQAASFSSRGPVTWQDVPPYNDYPYPPGLIKPDVAAPGVDTKSHNLCSGYSIKSGTSMATPHVAGAVALMKSSNPGLTHDDLKAILEDTSIDLGEPGKDNTYGSGRVDAYEAVLQSASSDGRISIRETATACSDVLHITLSDTDLKGTGTHVVEVTSETEPNGESVTLTETSATSGVFKGEISTDPGPPTTDGLIQVADGDTVVVTYIDADDGQGGTNVEKTDTSAVDCRGPVISAVETTDIDNTSATIRWTTDEQSDSLVRYDTTRPPGLEAGDSARVTQHAVPLTGLAECTVYYYDVTSADSLANSTTDDNNGQYYRFETYGDFADIGIAPCHQGQITLDQSIYACSDTVTVSVTDLDLNTDSGLVETVSVKVSSSAEPDGEWIVLTEENANSARFVGSIDMAPGAAIAGDGLLQAGDGNLVTATYHDADDGTGSPATTSRTSTTDCAAPVGSGVAISRLAHSWAEISWTTDEPSTTRLEYGPDAQLGNLVEDSALSTSHTVFIDGFDACQTVFFRVGGTDAYGNDLQLDTGNGPFHFSTMEVPGLYFYEGFEQGVGEWILGTEWEIASPAGKGGSRGNPDPGAAFVGASVLGLDLSGTGSYAGDYEPNAHSAAASGRILCSNCQNTELIFRRYLNVQSSDNAELAVISNGKDVVWNNGGATITENGWTEQRYDISAFADGKPFIQLRFSIDADGSAQYSGWNVDELIVKDGSLADYTACGDCGAAPSGRGLNAAEDVDACGTAGIRVEWEAATSWGTGTSGTYALYRGTTPDFVPDSGTLVAAGLTDTFYQDDNAPVDTTVWYLVRAENDETCSSGPNNGGLLDDNDNRLSAIDTTSRPAAGSPADSLRVAKVNDAHARLSWQPTPDTAHFIVRRSESPDMAGALDLGQTPETWIEDRDALTNAKHFFYKVVAVNPCGQETP